MRRRGVRRRAAVGAWMVSALAGPVLVACGGDDDASSTTDLDHATALSTPSPAGTTAVAETTENPATTVANDDAAPTTVRPEVTGAPGPLRLEPLWRADGFARTGSVGLVAGIFATLGENEYGAAETFELTFLEAESGMEISSTPTPLAEQFTVLPDAVVVGVADGEIYQVFDPTTGIFQFETTSPIVGQTGDELISADGTILSSSSGAVLRNLPVESARYFGSDVIVSDVDGELSGIAVESGLVVWTGAAPQAEVTVTVRFDDRAWLIAADGTSQVLTYSDGRLAPGPAVDPASLQEEANIVRSGKGCGSVRTRQAGFYYASHCSDDHIIVYNHADRTVASLDVRSGNTVPLTPCGPTDAGRVAMSGDTVVCIVEDEDEAAPAELVAVSAVDGSELTRVVISSDTTEIYGTVVTDGSYVVVTNETAEGLDLAVAYGFRLSS